MSGLQILQGQIAGDLPRPPIHYLTGLAPTEVGPRESVFTLPCHEWLCSPLGTVEGGMIAMLADSALVSAIQTTAPPGAAVAAVDLKVNFLRPVPPDGRELRAHGRVRHGGRTISIAEAGRARHRLRDGAARSRRGARRSGLRSATSACRQRRSRLLSSA